jgi:hypothetical protein
MTTALLLFLSQVPQSLDSPLGYGIIAAAMVFGMLLYHWLLGAPLRADKERAEARAEKAEAEKTQAYRDTLPALASTEGVLDRLLAVLPNLQAQADGQRRPRQGSAK